MRSNAKEESFKSLESCSTEALWNLITEAQSIIRKREYQARAKNTSSREYALNDSDGELEICIGDDSIGNVVMLETGIIDLKSYEGESKGKSAASLKFRDSGNIDIKLNRLKRKLLEISNCEELNVKSNKRAVPVSQSSQQQEIEDKMNEEENSDTQKKDSQPTDHSLSTEFYEISAVENINATNNGGSHERSNAVDEDMSDRDGKILDGSNMNGLRPPHIPPFCNFNKNEKDLSKDVNYSPNIKLVDELLTLAEFESLKTILQTENARNKNLGIYVKHYDEHYIKQLISVKDLPGDLKICLNYNPIRLKPWRIQDFKLNKKSEYNSRRELKKTKKYWEQENIVHDDFNDSYFDNFYKYFDNLKNVDNPLQLNDRMAYPNSQELKEDRHFLRIYEFNRCKKMLLLALNGSVSSEQRGYLFRNENLNLLVSTGLVNVDYDLLLISSRKEIEDYEGDRALSV